MLINFSYFYSSYFVATIVVIAATKLFVLTQFPAPDIQSQQKSNVWELKHSHMLALPSGSHFADSYSILIS